VRSCRARGFSHFITHHFVESVRQVSRGRFPVTAISLDRTMVVTRSRRRAASPSKSGTARRNVDDDATVTGRVERSPEATHARRRTRRKRAPDTRALASREVEGDGRAREPCRSARQGSAVKRKLTANSRQPEVAAVDVTIQRGTASPTPASSSVDEDCTEISGYFGTLPREIVEHVLGYLEPKELAMMDMTCRYFTDTGLTDQLARHHLKSIARAKGLVPMAEHGESSLMLLAFVRAQSAAAAQGTAVAMGTHHTMCLMSEELVVGSDGSRHLVLTGKNTDGDLGLRMSDDAGAGSKGDASYGIYSFGRGFHGQLGNGGHGSSLLPAAIKQVEKAGTTVSLAKGDGKNIRLAVVHAGSSHSMAISRRGELFTWGLSSSGELGHGTWSPTEVSIPKLVTSFGSTRIVSVCAGSNHTLAISEVGHVWSCGRNRHGQLGQGHMIDEAAFFMVDDLRNDRVVSVAAGKFHSMALAADGKLFTWGDNSGGQLGLANLVDHPSPVLVDYLDPAIVRQGARVTAIAAGGYHSFALTVSGQLMATGRHKEGQLGVGGVSVNGIKQFRRVPLNSSENGASGRTTTRVIQVQCGYLHSIALVQVNGKRQVRACGDNSFGQLGLDYSPYNGVSPSGVFLGHPRVDTFRNINFVDRKQFSKPGNGCVRVLKYDQEPITCIVSGDWHSGAITEGGHLFTWGRGDSGQLGHGTDISHWQPELLSGDGNPDPASAGRDLNVLSEVVERPYRVVHPSRTLRRRRNALEKEAVVLKSPPPRPKRRRKANKADDPVTDEEAIVADIWEPISHPVQLPMS